MKILIKEDLKSYENKTKAGVVYGNKYVIRYIVESKNLTYSRDIKKSGLSERTYRKMKNGTNAVKVDHFLKLVEYLRSVGVDVKLGDIIVTPKQADSISELEKELRTIWSEYAFKIKCAGNKERKLTKQLDEANEQLAEVKHANKKLHAEIKSALALNRQVMKMNLLQRLKFAFFKKI